MPKKLIFCFDGTCNDPLDSGDFFSDGSISNILKLHILFGGNLENKENSQTANQRSFYYSGVGTRGNYFQRTWNSMFAPPNAEVQDILKAAEKDLKNHFNEGDEIYVFGFSRGAAIARIFSAKNNKQKINFLGVFDTVAAMKTIDLKKDTYPASGILFENGTIGDHIIQVIHLLSIDEKRLAFQPTLMNKRAKILEVWFAGVHSDIGGGYWFDGLSDITLEFMLSKVEKDLNILDASKINFASFQKDGNMICYDDIEIKAFATGTLHEQKRAKMIASQTLAPRFIRVNINDKKSEKDLPIIHYTVCERFRKIGGYRPYALRNRKYKILNENAKISSERLGIAGLRKK